MVKNLSANEGDVGLIPGSGRSLGRGNGNPLQSSCLGNPTDRSLVGFSRGLQTVPTAQLENQDWAGVGRLSALWLSAAVYLVAAEPNPSLVFLLPCGILLAVRLPTDLASFLEDGAFNQVKPAS